MISRRQGLGGLALGIAATMSPRRLFARTNALAGILTPSERQWDRAAVLAALIDLGHVQGTTLRLDVRSADGDLAALPGLARDLASAGPDVIVAINSPAAQAAMAATRTIPIVAGPVGDPVGSGFASSLARPGRNVTGFSNMSSNLAGKRLGLLKEALPDIERVAVFYHPDELIVGMQMADLERTAPQLGIDITAHPMRTDEDLRAAFDVAMAARVGAVLRLAGQALSLGPATVRESLQRRVPAMVLTAIEVQAGGLMSYYADDAEQWRRMAALVDKVLKGHRPSELPFEQPTMFRLVVNLRTAATLGLTIPPSILIRADEVIE